MLSYTPYYIYQMMVAGGCTLQKLFKSFFASHMDLDYTKDLFNRTVWAVRSLSVSSNDLPERLGEVLAQMWRLGGTPATSTSTSTNEVDDSLMLKVRCRMSMSLLYDSVWRWREDARTKGRNIEGSLPQYSQYSLSILYQPLNVYTDKKKHTSKTPQTPTQPPNPPVPPPPHQETPPHQPPSSETQA